MSDKPQTVYEAIGGEPAIARLVDAFYAHVARDALLRPLFPPSFAEVRLRQFWFLTQLFGGPRLYTKHRGQPMLRMRHLPFPITQAHAQAWLACMRQAMEEVQLPVPAREAMLQRLTMTAFHMVNTDDESIEVNNDADNR